MLNLIIYIILSYGFVNLIMYFNGPFNIIKIFRDSISKISDGFAELFNCRACCSTWSGFFLSALNLVFLPYIPRFTPFNMLITNSSFWWLAIILDGIFTSGIVWFLFVIEDYITKEF